MGIYFFDQYSILHMAVGIIAYFFGIQFTNWIILHLLFEYLENTNTGIYIINTYFHDIWPGGKPKSDTFINSMLGDNFFAILGWLIAYYLDIYYKQF